MPDAHAHQSHAPTRRIARNAGMRAGGEVLGKLASMAFFIAIARADYERLRSIARRRGVLAPG